MSNKSSYGGGGLEVFLRAIVETTGPVRAEGCLVHRGRKLATAEGRLLDQNSKLLARSATTCMIMPLAEPNS
jgi:acyl-coenzyme A thioesterase PaaI-like protein